MSDITLIPEDNLKKINLKENEVKTRESRTDSIKIDITNTESVEIKNVREKNDDEERAESANKQDKDETICLEISNDNEDVEKASEDAGGKEYMVYGYYGGGPNQASLPTTWVQFQGGFDRKANIEPIGAPLDYEPQSRNPFILLVFSIVFVMILCTAGFTSFVLTTPDVKDMFRSYGLLLYIVGMVIVLGLSYTMACSACTRIFPCNIICLMLAVVGMSLMTGWITSRYNTDIVFYALIATSATVFVCICLACTNFDFTQWLLYVIAISAAFGVIVLIITVTNLVMGTYWKPLHVVILIIGTIINVVVLIIELQTILGGKAVELGEDDYALGAFFLYTAIIDLFLKLVQILGILDD